MKLFINTNTEHETSDRNEEWDAIILKDRSKVKLIPKYNDVLYIFQNENGGTIREIKGNTPLRLGEHSEIGREIKKHIDPKNDLKPYAISREFDDIRQAMNEYYEIQLQNAKNQEIENERLNEEELQAKLEEAEVLLQSKKYPLIYIGSIVSWLTGGERNNIMLTFIAYCSQVILNNPISVIGLGEGASGKTHIEEVAMSLIPDEFIRHEKGSTGATTFNRAKDNPHYYDGCIVNFGDLGGIKSQDFIMEAKNLLKELQSDGFVNKPLNVPAKDKGWDLIELTLYGRPALTYTTVPGFEFDDQEMSRSIFITPRMDNKRVFHAFKQIIELKHGRTYKKLKYFEKESKLIQYIVYLLKEKVDNLTIINPYTQSVIDFLGESEYFKRDFDKYNGLLKTITAFHAFTRPTFNLDGEEILFTSLDDIQIFIELLREYHESISVNISPKAAEILNDLRNNMDEWIFDNKVPENGSFTTNEYYEISGTKLSKRSIQRYFGELNRAGFLKSVGKENKSNIYILGEKALPGLLKNLLVLNEDQCQLIEWELGPMALRFIREDELMDGLSLMLQDQDIDVPGWERFDKRK